MSFPTPSRRRRRRPLSPLLWSLRDKVPCPPQAEEVLEAPLEEEEEEADATSVMTSTSREEVRYVKLGGCSAAALASWLFAALCAGLLTHIISGLVPGAAPPG